MLIASILSALSLLTNLIVLFLIYSLVKRIKESEIKAQKRHQAAMDKIVGLVPIVPKANPAPNEAATEPEPEQVLDENVPWDIPDDVKITVEGGDTLVPPGFEAT